MIDKGGDPKLEEQGGENHSSNAQLLNIQGKFLTECNYPNPQHSLAYKKNEFSEEKIFSPNKFAWWKSRMTL